LEREPRRESEGPIVPLKPVKAGGGKGPWFWVLSKKERVRGIGMGLVTPEKIRDLQRKLYVKAKGEPNFRFYSLYDKVYRKDILEHAYRCAKSNDGEHGVDEVTFEQIEEEGLENWLERLGEDLRTRRYKPEAVLRVYIPKLGGGERPLGIPTIRDRVAQKAAKFVLEPIFEAEFGEEMYGYRPKRSAQGAVEEVLNILRKGYTDVVDADLSKFFDTIPHRDLVKTLARRVSDGKMLHLVKMWLKVPVEEEDETERKKRTGGRKSTKGTPQGGVISPLLANIYMNRFLRAWRERDMNHRLEAKVVNYADDFVILSRGKAGEAMEVTRRWMTALGLTLNEEKTKLRDGRKETFDFLGYTFGPMVHKPTGKAYLGVKPSEKAEARLRDRVRVILSPGNKAPWEEVVGQINRVLRGWTGYFHVGSIARTYWRLNAYLVQRARGFLVKRHKVSGRGTRKFSAEKIYGSGLFLLDYRKRAACPHALA